jgi:hypothetical protein
MTIYVKKMGRSISLRQAGIIAKCPPAFLANMTKTVIFLTDSDVRCTKQEYRAQNK